MLKVENLSKTYPTFQLKDVSFHVPSGYIVGLIGKNGVGKSTTLKSMLNIVHPDAGKVTLFGEDYYKNESRLKQRVGIALGSFSYYLSRKIKDITCVYSKFFINWNQERYEELLKLFNIDESKRIRELSEGMRSKYATALALSHNAELIILDEPTSGLDPIARKEMLNLFQEIIEEGDKSILFSTHITSDLDKCADYIVLINNGEVVVNASKDDLIESHVLLGGDYQTLQPEQKQSFIGIERNAFGFTGLIRKDKILLNTTFKSSKPNIEDILSYYTMEDCNEKFII